MQPRKAPVLVAPDAFKGTLTATAVAAAIARGLRAGGWPDVDLCPLGDGGEGTAEALAAALGGGVSVLARVHDPVGREIDAEFLLVEDGRSAIVEVAAASGAGLVAAAERDASAAWAASTRGTGELLVAAARTGAQQLLLAAGGSATTDGGAGAIAAIEEENGLGKAAILVLCDVRTPWERAAAVFAPQKGADPPAVRRLQRRLARLAARLPRDPRGRPLTGAAGGLAGGLWAAFGARLEPGAAFVLDAVGFNERMRAAHAVVLGEGRIDASTLQGKLVWEAATRCRQGGVPCFAIAGERALDAFDARLLDLQMVLEGSTPAAIATAASRIVAAL
jgi:glycerate kinase